MLTGSMRRSSGVKKDKVVEGSHGKSLYEALLSDLRLAISADFYPTMLAMAGVPLASDVVDGESFEPLLRQSGSLKRDGLYWHYPHYHPGGATPYGAIREGDYRLVEFYEDDHIELYNLKDDIGETHDIAAKQPDKAVALRQKLHDWRQRGGWGGRCQRPILAAAPNRSRESRTRKVSRHHRQKSRFCDEGIIDLADGS